MFENITTTTVVMWVVSFLVSRYVIPRILKKDAVKKAIRVVDRNVDVVEGDVTFDWRTEKPAQYRPFKPVYYVTMGIAKTKESEWLKMEDTYEEVTAYRKRIAEVEPTETCLVSSEPAVSRKIAQQTDKAVEELYDWVIGYMLRKYPMHFVATGNLVTNLVTNEQVPRYASKRNKKEFPSTRYLLRLLCSNVEEDFLVMQVDARHGNEYVLRAATGIGANGFRMSEKMNQPLTTIHDPVPQYIQRLQLSMNRHFHKIQAGEFTQRLTWGIQVGGGMEQLFRPSGQHLSAAQTSVEELDGSKLDFSKDVFVRVERQVLSRLPNTDFIVLSVHTYMYALADIKQEGSAELLAKAIRALPEDTAHYKGRPRWGKAVLEYLDH